MGEYISWWQSDLEEIDAVFERAEGNEFSQEQLEKLEKGAWEEAKYCCDMVTPSGMSKDELFQNLPRDVQAQIVCGIGQSGLLTFNANDLASQKIVIELHPGIQTILCCTMFQILNRLENLDGALNVLAPGKWEIEVHAPLGGKKGLTTCYMLIIQLYDWLSVCEVSSNYMASNFITHLPIDPSEGNFLLGRKKTAHATSEPTPNDFGNGKTLKHPIAKNGGNLDAAQPMENLRPLDLPRQLAAGNVLGERYSIDRVLMQCGVFKTYMAMDLYLKTRVVIKEYYPESLVSRDETGRATAYAHTGQVETLYAKGMERFLQEAQALAQFQYLPGTMTVLDYFNANHTAYIVMEYIEGVTLKNATAQAGGRLPSAPLLVQLKPMIGSLEIVHSTSLLHGDISPDNIMVRTDGSFVLLGFDAARQFPADGEHSNAINVKHGYAPPEQHTTRGNQGPWTDVYALCATIYKATTGQTPPQSVDRMAGYKLPSPRKLGADLAPHQEAAVMKGLSLLIEDRFQSMAELSAELYG